MNSIHSKTVVSNFEKTLRLSVLLSLRYGQLRYCALCTVTVRVPVQCPIVPLSRLSASREASANVACWSRHQVEELVPVLVPVPVVYIRIRNRVLVSSLMRPRAKQERRIRQGHFNVYMI